MGVNLELVNFDEVFEQYQAKIPTVIDYNELRNNKFFKKSEREKKKPIGLGIVNIFSEVTEKDKELVNRSLYTRYANGNDLLSTLPSCECGHLQGEFRLNVLCNQCNTTVQHQLDEELHSLIWIQAPQGVDALINPVVWTMLNKRFSRSNFEIIRWLCDTSYAPLIKTPPVLEAVKALNIPRGYNNFIRNFDQIMEALFNLRAFKVRKDEVDELQVMIQKFRHCIFSKYMPVPNKVLLVVEETNLGTYVDPTIMGALDAIRTMIGIDSELSGFNIRTKENRTVKAIAYLSEFYHDMAKDIMASKQGIFRRHVFGSRSHFSFRAVISSLTDAHHYDQIEIPWGVGTSVFRVHLINKLFARNFNPNQAIAFLNEHAQKYHPLLDELFNELIVEAPGGHGIPAVMGRNPSLARGSAQAIFIAKVKTNIDDPTVGISILCVRALNADFDGDAMNFTLAVDQEVAEPLRFLAPHMSTFDLNEPRKVSSDLSMPKPTVATIAAWYDHEDGEVVDPEKLARMESLYD